MRYLLFLAFLCLCFTSCEARQAESPKSVKTGAEILLEQYVGELEGKRVGLVMNPTSRVDGVHMVDTLINLGVNVTALFAAEHGFRGDAGAGETIQDGMDKETGLPVFSLYGSTKKPTAAMLENIDLILFDLPDMGVRFYTYSTTMGLVMEAIVEEKKELWILDRPNPLGGEYVAGWILQDEFKSFVGAYPMPIAYGLTMGELANMAVGEGWLNLESNPNYRIIKTSGWQRDMLWPETGLEWIPPSPNLPTFAHAYAYPGTVIFEGTNISEGRGTVDPFLTIGAPQMQVTPSLLNPLEEKHSVGLDTLSFTPQSIPGKAPYPKLEAERCLGIRISFTTNFHETDPIELGLDLLKLAESHTPNFQMKVFANNLYGIDLKSIIEQGKAIPSWDSDVEKFKQQRAQYLLY
jgi:uncharacterized protein YbbC (DUF1343 family)